MRGLWKPPDGNDWLRGKLGLVLVGGALLSKSLIQFSVDGWSCVPSLSFTWGQTMEEVMKIMMISFKRSHASTATLSAPNPAAGLHWPTPLPGTPGHSRASLVQSLVVSLLLSPGSWCTQVSVCALLESPVLCKFWKLYGGVTVDLLQEGLCHTQVCCTQSPCPWGSPLLTRTSSGDTQTQFCLSPCGVSASWCARGLFEPSEHLWREWGLILNAHSPLLLSFWGFSAFGCEVSHHSCSSTWHLLGLLCPLLWGISSWSLQHLKPRAISKSHTGVDLEPKTKGVGLVCLWVLIWVWSLGSWVPVWYLDSQIPAWILEAKRISFCWTVTRAASAGTGM